MILWKLVSHTLVITTFVAVMMVAIEYLNVRTRGWWLLAVGRSRWSGYLVGVLLGALPGCLGAFALVTLYSARKVTLGAVVAGMVATSGDEMFVMLSLFPRTAALLTAGLVGVGLVAGVLTDLVLPASSSSCCSTGLTVHEDEEEPCAGMDPRGWLALWRRPSAHRVLLTVVAAVILLAFATGGLGPQVFNWKRVTLLVVVSFGLFVVSTTPDHFLDEHLWGHVATRHVPRIFAWTLGALAFIKGLEHYVDVQQLIASSPWAVLAVSAVVGIIPESGPHLVFVNLYDQGALPLGILVTSSIVQDGHGMLPMLAHSRLDFLKVKAANIVAGLVVGGAMLLGGSLL